MSTVHNITIDGGEIFVIEGKEGTRIGCYSMEDFDLLYWFGGFGNDLGRFIVRPGHSVWLNVGPDKIGVVSVGKVSFFTREGQLIQEKRTDPGRWSWYYMPLGDRYVVKKEFKRRGFWYYGVRIYDKDFKELKEIYRALNPTQEEKINKYEDFHFQVYKDKIWIWDDRKGLTFEVYDEKGKKVKTINWGYALLPVTEEIKRDELRIYSEHPAYRDKMDMIERRIRFPERLPAIADCKFADDRIYVLTFKKVSGETEFYVFDLDGGLLERTYVPVKYTHNVLPFPYAIQGGVLYQASENEATGRWELFRMPVGSGSRQDEGNDS